MKTNKITAAALALLLSAATMAQDATIPIIGYMGVRHDMSSDKTFKAFKEAGFDINITDYHTLTEVKTALHYAQRQGVKIISRCVETDNHPDIAARELKGYQALQGYVISDEPSATKFARLDSIIKVIRKFDKEHTCYVNLLPYYDDKILKTTQTKTYTEYVQKSLELGTGFLSFDYYPITNSGLRSSWYRNLEIIRDVSLRANVPFWGFVLSTPHAVYPHPTESSLRLQAYSNLAYGAQAIQYYSYWTSRPINYDFHDGPITWEGKQTDTYSMVKAINKELKHVGRLFIGASVNSVRHLQVIPIGTSALQVMPTNIENIINTNANGLVISEFTKDGHIYLALVNKDYEHSTSIQVIAANVIPKRVRKDLKEETLKNSYAVAPGDILILRLT